MSLKNKLQQLQTTTVTCSASQPACNHIADFKVATRLPNIDTHCVSSHAEKDLWLDSHHGMQQRKAMGYAWLHVHNY